MTESKVGHKVFMLIMSTQEEEQEISLIRRTCHLKTRLGGNARPYVNIIGMLLYFFPTVAS